MIRSSNLLSEPEKTMEHVSLVSMGINPSADRLHQGHFLTLYQFLFAMSRKRRVEGICFVDDREFDTQKFLPNNPEHFSLSHPVNACKIERTIIDAVREIATKMKEHSLEKQVRVCRMSEWLKEKDFHGDRYGLKLFKMIQDNREIIKTSFNPFTSSDFDASRIMCPCCYTATRGLQKVEKYGNIYGTVCKLPNCKKTNENFYVCPEAGVGDWTMYYPVDPLRDVLFANERSSGVLHVFGGDYGVPWAAGKSKCERLASAIKLIAPNVTVHHSVGPLLMRGTRKVSKSNGDACDSLPLLSDLHAMLQCGQTSIDLEADLDKKCDNAADHAYISIPHPVVTNRHSGRAKFKPEPLPYVRKRLNTRELLDKAEET
jgi:hypothetical protein